MDYSAARDGSSSQSLPEEKLNMAILCMAFVYKAMNGLGTLATIWATVVLLGGFATQVKERDFWYVTVIAFIQSIGILGGYEDPAHQIFLRAPRTLIKNTAAAKWELEISWWRRRRNQTQQQQQQQAGGTRRADRLRKKHEEVQWGLSEWRTMLGVAIHAALWLAQVAAVATCMFLSSKRLSEQDYTMEGQANPQNIKLSLNIFYGLVLAQGIIFVCLLADLLVLRCTVMVGKKYRMGLPSGHQILFRYRNDNYLEFITGNVHATLNMDLVTFAQKLAVSDPGSAEDHLLGVRAMDRIFRSVDYSGLALTRLRASLDADALGKLINMLGFIRSPVEQDIRGHAARVVLKLAPDLLVESFPQILYLISSSLLINTANRKMDVDLIWFGLRILDKLTDNPDNCIQANKNTGDLLSKIIDLTDLCGRSSGMSNTISDSWIEQEIIPLLQKDEDIPPPSVLKIDQEIIVGMSLNILSKLIAAMGDDNPKDRTKLTSKVLKSANFLRNSGMILEHVEATRVIACLAVDEKARNDIGRLPGIIKKLKDCLLSKAPHVNITKLAAKLLLLEYSSSDQLNQIQSSIEENHALEGDQSLLLPVTAFIEELDLDQLVPTRLQRIVPSLDLEDLISAPRVNHSEAAAEALVLLTTGCKDNAAALLQEITDQELQTVVEMLTPEFNEEKSRRMLARLQGRNVHPQTSRVVKKLICAEDGEHGRSMIAKLLQNLRGYETEIFPKFMQVIDQALPKVLKTIVDEVVKLEDTAYTSENLADVRKLSIFLDSLLSTTTSVKDDLRFKEGKVLESFVGLAWQICSSLNANDFEQKLQDANVPVNTLVQKLKKILDVYKSPSTDFPSIRRSTLELMIWMAENCINYREILLQCGVYEQAEEVAKTARGLESFELFHCGVGIGNKSTSSISSLVSQLQAQLALSPNFEERYRCYGEHADNITVLIA